MKRTILLLILTAFGFNGLILPSSYGQEAFLPEAGRMVMLSAPYAPPVIRGMKLDPHDPFKFDFIIDQGDAHLNKAQVKKESRSLIGYFLASLTTPEKEIWVNLSPYERERIVPPEFGQTQMGQELLGQDYLLKQIMATALYPENELGKKFWAEVYKQAQQKFGTTDVAINTFNKVWIVPDKAVVYENARMNAVFVVDSSLKVMLDQDYLAARENKAGNNSAADASLKMIKEVIIPALEKDVNTGANFARLRQVYQSLILAKWYKDHLKQSVLGKGYIDRDKINGITGVDRNLKEKIYYQYLKAYRKGVYNFIKEDVDPISARIVPRKYFSGGVTMLNVQETNASKAQLSAFRKMMLSVGLFFVGVSLGTTTAASQTVKVNGHQKHPTPTLVSRKLTHKTPRKNLSKKAKDDVKKNWVIPEGIERNTPRTLSDDPMAVEPIPIEAGLQPFPIGNSFYADFGQSRRMNRFRLFTIHLGVDVPEDENTPILNPFKVPMLVEDMVYPLAGKYLRLSLEIDPNTLLLYPFIKTTHQIVQARLVVKFEHVSEFNTSVNGKKVPMGTWVGNTGMTGNAKGGPEPSHVHAAVQLEIDELIDGKIITTKYVLDPYSYLVNFHSQPTPEMILNNSLEEGYNRYALLQKYFSSVHSFICFTQALMNTQIQPKLGKNTKSRKRTAKPDFWDLPGASHIDKQTWNTMANRMTADGYLSPSEDWTIPTMERYGLIQATLIEDILENEERTRQENEDTPTSLKRLIADYMKLPVTSYKVDATMNEFRKILIAYYRGADINDPVIEEIMNYPKEYKVNTATTVSPSNHAMITIQHTGGIDLRKTSVQIQPGSGQIVTAFDDPRQLKMLLNAAGIIPVIESVTPASAEMMSTLLGH